ncbi:MAG TPA: TonB-dependent siderophore receptor [Thermoanaerobaculia bacterium]|nr:TonB-dependent siderophore receptor [Thermoanaerobaculia bacterium]
MMSLSSKRKRHARRAAARAARNPQPATTGRSAEASFGRSRWLVGGALAASAALGFRVAAAPTEVTAAGGEPRTPVLVERLGPARSAVGQPMLASLFGDGAAEGAAARLGQRESGPGESGERTVLHRSARFDIPPGPLRAVLAAYTAATGLRVEATVDELLDLASPGVRGDLTAAEALDELLAGTVVTYRFTAEHGVRLELAAIEDHLAVVARPQPRSPVYGGMPLVDIPQSVTVVPEALLEEQNATTLRDALRNVTGISIQAGEGGVPAGDNLSIRGFNARTDLFIDGVRDVGGYSRDPFNLEQVEVVKGPASAFLGRGSTGGAVNLVSKTPHVQEEQSVSLGAGTEDYGRATVDVNQPLAGLPGAAVRINGMWTQGGAPGREAVEDRRWGIAPSVVFGLGTGTRFTLGYFHLEQENVPDYGIPWVPGNNQPLAEHANQAPPVDFDNFYGLVERDYEDTRTSVATAQVEHDFDDALALRSITRWGETSRDSVITAPRFTSTDSTEIRRTDWKSRDQIDSIVANQTDLVADFATGAMHHRLVTGVELAFEGSENFAREETGPEPGGTDLFDPDPYQPYHGSIERTGAKSEADARSVAVYAFDTVDLSRRWQVSGGLRWDRFDLDYAPTQGPSFERVDEMLSWRAGAVFKPLPTGSVYAGAGTSFNPSAEGLSLNASLAEVEPEKSRSYELGTKWELFGMRASFSAAVFQTEKTNARTPGLDADDPPTVLAGEQRVRGLEVGLSGRLTPRWTAWLGYTAMDSEVLASNGGNVGNELGNTPDQTASLWTTYRFRNGLEVGAGAHYTGDRYNNDNSTRLAPGYWLYDAMLSYDLGDRLTLRLNGTNLADEEFIDRVGGGHFIPGRGRSVALTTVFSR